MNSQAKLTDSNSDKRQQLATASNKEDTKKTNARDENFKYIRFLIISGK